MVRTLLVLAWLLPFPVSGGTAADIARAVRENSFDRAECYRVRDLTFLKEDIRVYLTDGYLIFSKPVAGRRMAAVFSTEVEGGDGEVIPPPPECVHPDSGGGAALHGRRLRTTDEPDGQQPGQSQSAGNGAGAGRAVEPGAAQPGHEL